MASLVLLAFLLSTLCHYYCPKAHPSYPVGIRVDKLDGSTHLELNNKAYTTIEGLEDYFKTLPPDEDVSCIVIIRAMVSSDQARLPATEHPKVLKDLSSFCSKQGIRFHAVVMAI